MMKETILLIEDDIDLLENNTEYLQRHGYRVLTSETLADAAAVLAHEHVDLILLDINLPDGSGLDFIVEIRETSDVPVIFLTCRTDRADMIGGLTSGGCDYITKPFDFGVMLARIEAQLRQARSAKTLTRGSLMLDMVSGRAYLNGEDMQLTKKEFAVLRILVESGGKAFTKESLYETVWGQPMNNNDTALKTSISRLRKKLEADGFSITASRSEGYRFE